MAQNRIRVGKIEDVSGEVIIAGRDVYKGYTPEQVSVLLTQITSTLQPKPFDGRCPYKGLEVFVEEDADLFFGRERVVDDLVNRLQGSRALFITGPSGSGKSSLARAGLLHALKQGTIEDQHSERWCYETMKPGREPLEALALVFSRLKSPELAEYFRKHLSGTSILNACAESVLSEAADQRFVLFVDQFEEVFTQISNETERMAFLQVLTEAVAVENGRVILLFAMRSDFVSNCANYPALNALLNQPSAFAQIGAMQRHELVSAIAQPALQVGLRIDPDLIAQIINDMKGEPGTLPLMQFALKDLFNEEQAKGSLIALTLAGYVQRGGIHKSLERHADDAFTKLSSNEQELARSIFGSLIEIGRGTPDTGRTALFEELIPASAKAQDVKAIVEKLADARLITTDEQAGKDLVTISHERLIDAWPWLRRLINENRDAIAVQNEIAGDAKEWDDHQRDPSYLYTGARLANAREKLEAKQLVLSGLSQSFLDVSTKAYRDELEAARYRAAQLRTRAIYLTVALITALAAVGVAVFYGLQSRRQAQLAFTRQLAAQAMVIQEDKRDLAMLMSIQAFQLNDEFQTRSSLLSTLQCCSDALISFLGGHEDSVWDVAFSPNGELLASSGNDGSIRIWNAKELQQIRLLQRDSSATVYTVAFSPTAPLLAAGDGTGSITLYDTQTWEPLAARLHEHESSVLSIKFSRDGKWLVSGGTDGKVLVWDIEKRELYKTFEGHENWVWDVAISADNKTVASVGRAGSESDPLHLWGLEPGMPDQHVSVPFSTLVSVAFNDNPHSRILVTGDAAGNVVIWDLAPWHSEYKEPLPSKRLSSGSAATGSVWGLAFIPGHNLEIVTGRDTGILNRNQILLKNDFSRIALQRESLGVTGNNFGVFRIDVSPDGKLIAAGGQDGLVSLWHASEVSSVIRHRAKITSLQLLNSGSTVAVSVDGNGSLYYWDYAEQKILEERTLDTGQIRQSAMSPDGTKVVTGYDEGELILWDGRTGEKLSEQTDGEARITSLVFSPDGRQLASSDDKGNVILWNVKGNGLERSTSFAGAQGSVVYTLLFSPDGRTLLGGGCGYPITFPSPDCSQGAVYVWDTQSGLKHTLPGKAAFVWSMALNPANPDELAVGTRDGTVTIWNLHAQKSRLSFRVSESDITALAFSPDGELLAVGAYSYKVLLYDSHTGQLFGKAFREHDDVVTALAFLSDGDTLLSASSDNTIVIHDMNAANWRVHACRVANRNLTRREWDQYIGDTLPYQAICPEFPTEPEATPTP